MKSSTVTDVMLGLFFWAACLGFVRYLVEGFLDPLNFEITQQIFVCLALVWILLGIISVRNIGRGPP